MSRMDWPLSTLLVIASLAFGTTATAQVLRFAAPSIDEVRRASVSWENRPGPARRVVDQVCLVPDLPTFFEAIATWDRGHFFPILIDDAEYSFRFLRAFRPSRIVRFPRKVPALAPELAWDRALDAVARAATSEVPGGEASPRADTNPDAKARDTPGIVLSTPDSPMLAGAVALAAGRSQRLVRWGPPKRFGDVLSPEEAHDLALALEERVAALIPGYDRLGDDCDFLTLAVDCPYRYTPSEGDVGTSPSLRAFFEKNRGPLAFDDLIGRAADGRARWAFTGRLLGDATSSVYRAMCSLFLQPESALLFNTYEENGQGWSEYRMGGAALLLASILPVTERSGNKADLSGWHRAFDPINRFGLVLINSHGGPTQFHVTGGTASTRDVPPTVPSVVVMIHSFSATDPTDANMIAGRWLANGAYVYYGSMNEPALQSFRTPEIVAALIAEGVPLGAALRQSPPEAFGGPWRLLYLGDPLYRVKPRDRAERVEPGLWAPARSWPRYEVLPPPGASAEEDAKLHWAVRTAVAQLGREATRRPVGEFAATLLAIRRERLALPLRPFLDALVADTLLESRRPGELRARLSRIPPGERPAGVRHLLETCQVLTLQQLAATHDFARAEAIWTEILGSGPPREILEQATARVGALADSSGRRPTWATRLRSAERSWRGTPTGEVIASERRRVEKGLLQAP